MEPAAKGAIAAGHPATAAAGARVLEDGGNAVDACLAAAFAAFVAEGPLTGATGGGFLLAYVGGNVTLLDCFFAVPAQPLGEIEHLTVDFGSTTQSYHVGLGSVAVPGLVAGLLDAHERWGTMPWADLFAPALELARTGVEVTAAHRVLHEVLSPVLLRDEGGRRIYGEPERLVTHELVETLEALREDPAAAVVALLPELADDLASYLPLEREPLRGRFAGHEVLATPAPSRGGVIVVAALEAFDEAATIHERALALRTAYARSPASARGTTHISVVDARGDAIGLSSTLGAGSGVHRCGAQLNNMLGEFDIIGHGPKEPGERLASMMTPTLVLDAGRPRLVLGSAGSVRLSGAIAQVVDNVLTRGDDLSAAIAAPRLHVVDGTLHLEGGWPPATASELPPEAWEFVSWQSLNLYFGGVSAVELAADGTLGAAGDPRRGGHGIVVA
ncbi:MAG TPA: gamma-glutamyltransferase [Gaiellaceae bacterium]|nr:gamma-glutamyltransferase [Gaiellaceae bacterium]